ncbi:MAG: hypothetical protein ABI887_03570 [Burkholderiales bacterium]
MNQLPDIHVCLIHPPGYLHADALLDPALFFKHQFERFGVGVTFGRNQLRHGAVNFVFGAHNGFNADVCKHYSCIVVNLEQIGLGGARLPPAYLDLLRRSAVVDYDPANPPAYTAHPEDVPIARFGHAPYLASADLTPLEDRPIDLLFFGCMNPRRRRLIDRIEAAGRKVTVAVSPIYGAERDALIRRAKAVVNVPFYESARFEQVRAFLCLSLGTPVLSERLPASCPSEAFDACVTWFDETQIEPLFGEEFGTPEFYDVMRQQVAMFQHADPLDEFADVMAFAAGVWQAHSQTAIGQTVSDATLEFGGAQPPAAPVQETGADADRTGRQASPLFQYLDRSAARVAQCIAEARHDDALQTMAMAVHQHFCQPRITHRALYYPEFDRQIERLSQLLPVNHSRGTAPDADAETTLIVATEVFQVGGHTKVLEDVARAVKRPLIVLTDLFATYGSDTPKQRWIFEKFAGIEVILLSEGSLWEKSRALATLAAQRRVGSVLYFQHHQDPVAFVGTLSHAGSRKILVHHCDHNPSLGCTLAGVQHVDLSEHLRQTCQGHLDQTVKLLPLHVPDQGCRPLNPIEGRAFSIVTSGRAGKFTSTGALSLQNIVQTALGAIDGNFYFIGPLQDEWIASIRTQLSTAGIAADRFVPLGLVASLWERLRVLDASFYLGSAPVGGGRAAIEAQGAGLPTLFFTGFEAGSLIENYSVYADASLGWANLDELAALLSAVAPHSVERSLSARRYYEDNFSERHFRECLEELLGSAVIA